MIITIDGPSGTGKSTLARLLANRLSFAFFDTGALYRAIAWKVLDDQLSPQDIPAIEKMLQSFRFNIKLHGDQAHYFVNDQDVTTAIRTEEVSTLSSHVAALQCVRDAMRPVQHEFAKEKSSIFEGRDLGTIVFPHADVKFFLTARPEVRAKRRLADLKSKFPQRAETFSYEEILEKIRERDEADSSRSLAPLKKADDAILVDVSDVTIKEALDILENLIKK